MVTPRAADEVTAGGALVALIMGSRSDWETMRDASDVLRTFGVEHESRVISAHRTPGLLSEYAAAAQGRGIRIIIAGAGGAAHLPGMAAAQTNLPVIGVPVQSSALLGFDSLLSIVQMPRGVPVATMAIGPAGAANAGYLAVRILAGANAGLMARLDEMAEAQRMSIEAEVLE